MHEEEVAALVVDNGSGVSIGCFLALMHLALCSHVRYLGLGIMVGMDQNDSYVGDIREEPSMTHGCELSRARGVPGRREFYSQLTWHPNSMHSPRCHMGKHM